VACCGGHFTGSADAGAGIPVTVPGLSNVDAISIGEEQMCAMSGGSVACWGNNSQGQAGLGGLGSSATPVTVPAFGGATSISCTWRNCCAIHNFGHAACTGINDYLQLQSSNPGSASSTPIEMAPFASGARTLSIAWRHDCIVDGNAAIWCWGSNLSGEIGNGQTSNSASAATVVW
jgi:alpha-tubulin suppressor-like RCC1 family protein